MISYHHLGDVNFGIEAALQYIARQIYPFLDALLAEFFQNDNANSPNKLFESLFEKTNSGNVSKNKTTN